MSISLLLPLLYMFTANGYFFLTLQTSEMSVHHIIGFLLANLAFVLWIVARIQLGRAFSLMPKAKHLVTTGLYSKLRHPVYYFSIFALIGILIFSWNMYVLLAVIALVALQITRLKEEEKVLYSRFGSKYIEYKRSTWL